MFSGLIGFIRPRSTQNATETRPVGRTRSATDDKEFELDLPEDEAVIVGDDDKGPSGFDGREDTLSLSIEALEKAIGAMDIPQIKQRELQEVFKRLKEKGIKTLPFDPASSLIEQVEKFDRMHK